MPPARQRFLSVRLNGKMLNAVRIRPTLFLIVALYCAGGYEPPLQLAGSYFARAALTISTDWRHRSVISSQAPAWISLSGHM